MIEFIVEYSLSVLDYMYLVFFFSKLIEKRIEIFKYLLFVTAVAGLQYILDSNIPLSGYKSLCDSIFVIVILTLYSGKVSVYNILNAVMINCIFVFCVVFINVISKVLYIDIEKTLVFGLYRIIYALTMKIIIIGVLNFLIQPLISIKKSIDKATAMYFTIAVSVGSYILSYFYRDSINHKDTLLYVLLFTLFLSILYYLIIKHSIALKKNADYAFIENSINMTMAQVDNIQKEQIEIRQIKHDYKNELLILGELMKKKEYEKIESYIAKQTNEINDFKSKNISGNLYVDAILNQKINQYKDIEFDMDIKISKTLKIDNRDMVSLLSNIIDNACEELNRIGEHILKLEMYESKQILTIIETNKCRKDNNLVTDKKGKEHGYGLRIIKGIVDKYEGEIETTINDHFTIKINMII